MVNKLSYEELRASMQMFFLNKNIDSEFMVGMELRIAELRSRMSNINTKEGLREYIINYPDSLDNILCLLNVSSEFFKRVISMLRLQKGQIFDTEWSISQTRNYLLEQDWIMDKVCDLFINGANNPFFINLIPTFNLQFLKIDYKTIARLANDDILFMLVKKDYESKFSSRVTNSKADAIGNAIKEICFDLGCNYKVNVSKTISRSNITIPYIISEMPFSDPKVLILYSFMITTGSGQTNLKNKIKEIKTHKNEVFAGAKIVVIVDGAGWIGRQSDLKDIHDYADYCINMNHISDLKEIINQFI